MEENRQKIGLIQQISVLFILGIFLTGIITYGTEYYVTERNVKAQVENLASQTAREVTLAVREYPAYEWLLRYWYENADTLDIEYDAEYWRNVITKEKCRVFSERHPDLQLDYLMEEEIRALSDEDQKLYAEIAYSWFITRINQIKRANKIDFLFCVVVRDPYDRQFFLFSAADEGAKRGTDYEEVYTIGTTVTVSETQQEAMKQAVLKDAHLGDAGKYFDYYAYMGTLKDDYLLLGMTYNISDIRSTVDQNTLKEVSYAVFHQIFLSLLWLIAIYLFVIKPLKDIQKSIRFYIETKDTETTVKDLTRVRSRNELGQLANDVRDMAIEMSDYTNEIKNITAEQERIGTELSVATRIQAAMLPHVFPPFPQRHEIDIYASMDPAKEVGGDFYDFFFVDEDHLCVIMADVSGKGVPAALFMMASKIILQSVAMLGRSVSEVLALTNEAICSNNQEDMFVTVWIGMIEVSTGKLVCSNAGHEYPTIKDADGDFRIYKDKHGLVIGALDGMKYTEYELQLEPGAKIFVYTDGVPEATNADGEMFGMERTIDALNEVKDKDPESVLKNIRRRVDEFTAGAEQFDDLTMLCLEYKGKGE